MPGLKRRGRAWFERRKSLVLEEEGDWWGERRGGRVHWMAAVTILVLGFPGEKKREGPMGGIIHVLVLGIPTACGKEGR